MGQEQSKKRQEVKLKDAKVQEGHNLDDSNYNLKLLLNLLSKYEKQYTKYNFFKKDFPFLLIQVENKNTNSQSMLKVIDWKQANISDLSFLRQSDLVEGEQVITHIIQPIDQFFLILDHSIRNESEYPSLFSNPKQLKDLSGFIVLEYDFEEYVNRYNLEQRMCEEQLMGMYSIAIAIKHRHYGSYEGQVPSLCEQLQLCSNLEYLTLDLRQNGINSQGAKQLGNSLSECLNLKSLKVLLQSNHIENVGLKGFLSEIPKLSHLQELSLFLGLTKIESESGEIIGKTLSLCQNLKSVELDLIMNSIGQQGSKYIGQGLSKCIKLINLTIEMRSNGILQEGLNHLLLGISQCQNLQNLNLRVDKNEIQGNFSQLGEGISKLLNLKTLFLSLNFNNLSYLKTQGGFLQLLQGIAKCTQLTNITLRLQENSIGDTDEGIQSLGFNNCQNLTNFTLLLGKNNIGLNILKVLVPELGQCRKIQQLNLDLNQQNSLRNNQIENCGIDYLCRGISQLNMLTSLSLSLDNNRQITGCGDKDFDLGLSKLSQLTHLRIDLNNVGNLSTLSFVQLSQGISCCKLLENLSLDLGGCTNFKDSIRDFMANIAKCQQVKILNLHSQGNELGQEEATYLGLGITMFQQLEQLTLTLSNNYFKGLGALNLIKGVSQSNTLKKLNLFLGSNQLDIEHLLEFATQFQYLKKLQNLTLYLGSNAIENSIIEFAEKLSKCQRLVSLDLVITLQRYQKSAYRQLIKAKRLVRLGGTYCNFYI